MRPTAIFAVTSRVAIRTSYSVCRFSQKRGFMLKNSPNRSAVSAVTGRVPCTSSLIRLGDTSMSAASGEP